MTVIARRLGTATSRITLNQKSSRSSGFFDWQGLVCPKWSAFAGASSWHCELRRELYELLYELAKRRVIFWIILWANFFLFLESKSKFIVNHAFHGAFGGRRAQWLFVWPTNSSIFSGTRSEITAVNPSRISLPSKLDSLALIRFCWRAYSLITLVQATLKPCSCVPPPVVLMLLTNETIVSA